LVQFQDDLADVTLLAKSSVNAALHLFAICQLHARHLNGPQHLAMRFVLKLFPAAFTLCLLISPAFADPQEDTGARPSADADSVIATITEILEEARQIAPTDRQSALRAYLLLREAKATLTRAQVVFPEATSLEDAAIASASRVASLCDGNAPRDCMFAEAESLAVRSGDLLVGSSALIAIAEARARAGQLDEAASVAMQIIPGTGYRGMALTRIAIAHAEAGQFFKAIRMATQTGGADRQARVLSGIAGAMADQGEMTRATQFWSQAERKAKQAKNDSRQALALRHIGRALAGVGRLAEAERIWSEAENIAMQIEDTMSRDRALGAIARSRAQVGQFAEAERIATQIAFYTYRTATLTSIAGARAEAGQVAKAERISEQIEDAFHRAQALSHIAAARAEAGQHEEAERVWSDAEDFAGQVEDAGSRAKALSDIAAALAEAGQFDKPAQLWSEAERSAAEDGRDFDRAWALGEIASARAEAGQFAKAERIAAQIEDVSRRASALARIASQLF